MSTGRYSRPSGSEAEDFRLEITTSREIVLGCSVSPIPRLRNDVLGPEEAGRRPYALCSVTCSILVRNFLFLDAVLVIEFRMTHRVMIR